MAESVILIAIKNDREAAFADVVMKNRRNIRMASLTLKNIYKIYAGGVTAVTDFNLDIEDKEFIILVGPSGCG